MAEQYVAAGIAQGSTREAVIEGFASVHPMKRFGDPREAANAIVYLASEESSYTTGADLPVEGRYPLSYVDNAQIETKKTDLRSISAGRMIIPHSVFLGLLKSTA